MSIFKESEAYRPFTYSWAVDAEKQHRIDMHWHEGQVDLQDDLRQFSTKGGLATKNVSHESNKNMLERLIMLFTEMDVQVGGGYAKLLPHVHNNEIRTMWFTFAAREVTHQRGYALAAETFGYTASDWSEFRKYKEMSDKVDLLTQDLGDLSNKLNFCKQLAVVLNGEGISLFGAFACLLNLRRFGLVNGFNTVNEWSLKDEQEHVRNNMKVLDEARKDLSEAENIELDKFIKKIVKLYVDAELAFLDLVFEMGDQEGLTLTDAKEFIRYLAELRLYQLGLLSFEDVRENPLEWIDYILTASTHTSFFENKVVDYSHNGLSGKVDYSKHLGSLESRLSEEKPVYIVWGKSGCPYCDKAKALLASKRLQYRYIDIESDPNTYQEFKSKGFKTVPQIWEDETYVGGYTELLMRLGLLNSNQSSLS